jgi:hypothetical protein
VSSTCSCCVFDVPPCVCTSVRDPKDRHDTSCDDLDPFLTSDMSPEVHCNLCNHCYILGMPDPRPDIRCLQYLSEVHKKVPNKFGHKREPLKSGPDIRDPKHHWISNRYPQPSGRCQKWIQSIIRCQQWIQNIMRGHRDL